MKGSSNLAAQRGASALCAPRGRLPRRRALVLLVVMLTLSAGAIGAISSLALAAAASQQSRALSDRQSSLDAARAGLAVVAAQIESQRDDLLRGGEPTLESTGELGVLPDGSRLVYRLRPLTRSASGSGSPGSGTRGSGQRAGSSVVQSESAKLNINAATPEMLARVPAMSEPVARAIVERRDAAPLQSVAELVGVGGLTRADVFGDESSTSLGRTALADLLTVLSVDPIVQSGIPMDEAQASDAAQRVGVRRINLNVPWSDALYEAVRARWDKFAADVVKELMTSDGIVFSSEKKLLHQIRRQIGIPANWAPLLDSLTTTDEPVRVGRVDLLRATEPVLRALGLSEAAASTAVDLRGSLDDIARLSPVWIATNELVTHDEFESIIESISTRSLVWRVVIEAGVEPPQDGAGADGAWLAGEGFAPPPVLDDTPPLAQRVVLEAVIDASYERARVSYLRDVTHLDAALTLASGAFESLDSRDLDDGADDRIAADPLGNDDGPFEGDPLETSPSPMGAAGGGVTGRASPEFERPATSPAGLNLTTPAPARSERSRRRGGGGGDDPATAPASPPGAPRVGRWIVPPGG